MALKGIDEIYCQHNGFVLVSRDGYYCIGCSFNGSGKCPHVDCRVDKFLCELLGIHWEKLDGKNHR